jgi:hypothetical protein
MGEIPIPPYRTANFFAVNALGAGQVVRQHDQALGGNGHLSGDVSPPKEGHMKSSWVLIGALPIKSNIAAVTLAAGLAYLFIV